MTRGRAAGDALDSGVSLPVHWCRLRFGIPLICCDTDSDSGCSPRLGYVRVRLFTLPPGPDSERPCGFTFVAFMLTSVESFSARMNRAVDSDGNTGFQRAAASMLTVEQQVCSADRDSDSKVVRLMTSCLVVAFIVTMPYPTHILSTTAQLRSCAHIL